LAQYKHTLLAIAAWKIRLSLRQIMRRRREGDIRDWLAVSRNGDVASRIPREIDFVAVPDAKVHRNMRCCC